MKAFQIWWHSSEWDGCNGISSDEGAMNGLYSSYEKALKKLPKDRRGPGFSTRYSIKEVDIE